MSMNKERVWNSLSALWADNGVPTMPIKDGQYAILSDIHLGDGGPADDFHTNERALLNALEHYRENKYKIILLGDIEEFWQFDLHHITGRYQETVYKALRAFGDRDIHRIFGNHDLEWGGLSDPTRSSSSSALVKLADEAIKLADDSGQPRILLVHGHQGSLESHKYAWFSRFFVRAFKGIEPFVKMVGLYGHGPATKSPIARDYERIIHDWAKKNKVMIICGHSHRAIFASQAYANSLQNDINELRAKVMMRGIAMKTRLENLREISRLEAELEDEREKGRAIETIDPEPEPHPCYFNTGCGLYSDGLTAVEIAKSEIRLVKWNNDEISTPVRKVYERGKLSDLLVKIAA
jgi:UDP-2,3-diacylglucosamine pyrophosphatase LpxH